MTPNRTATAVRSEEDRKKAVLKSSTWTRAYAGRLPVIIALSQSQAKTAKSAKMGLQLMLFEAACKLNLANKLKDELAVQNKERFNTDGEPETGSALAEVVANASKLADDLDQKYGPPRVDAAYVFRLNLQRALEYLAERAAACFPRENFALPKWTRQLHITAATYPMMKVPMVMAWLDDEKLSDEAKARLLLNLERLVEKVDVSVEVVEQRETNAWIQLKRIRATNPDAPLPEEFRRTVTFLLLESTAAANERLKSMPEDDDESRKIQRLYNWAALKGYLGTILQKARVTGPKPELSVAPLKNLADEILAERKGRDNPVANLTDEANTGLLAGGVRFPMPDLETLVVQLFVILAAKQQAESNGGALSGADLERFESQMHKIGRAFVDYGAEAKHSKAAAVSVLYRRGVEDRIDILKLVLRSMPTPIVELVGRFQLAQPITLRGPRTGSTKPKKKTK